MLIFQHRISGKLSNITWPLSMITLNLNFQAYYGFIFQCFNLLIIHTINTVIILVHHNEHSPQDLNLADFMLQNNLFKLPQISTPKNPTLPSGYQLLDDAVTSATTPKTEVLSPTSDTKQKLHQCPYCEARFNQKSNLKTHVFGVHQFKLSTCRTCKIITSKEKLKEHMKTHPNRGYRCHQCDTSFDTHIR